MTKVPVECGVFENTPFPVYQSWDAVNFSTLKAGLQSAAHLKHAIDNPDSPDTPETRIGHAMHCLVWQPGEYADRYFECDDISFATKEGKAHKADAEASKKIVLRYDEHTEARKLAAAVLADKSTALLIQACDKREVAIVWDDPETGIRRKALIDGLHTDTAMAYLVDLKSTRSAKPDAFSRAIFDYGYHIQMESYKSGVLHGYGLAAPAMLMAVEKEEPRLVCVFELDADAAEIGAREERRLLNMLKRCRDTGEWPGYGTDVQRIGLPAWAVRQHEEALANG